MGTTAEKLSYLNETKTQIKNALETPSNTFRDYPTLIKKYIDNQPTKTVTDGMCDNAVELPIVSLGADGNSEQEATAGYQLFDWNGVSTPTIATYENGVAKLMWTGGFDVFFLNNSKQYLNDLDTTKEYTISFKHKGNAIRMLNYATSQYNVVTNNDNDYAKYSFTVTGVSSIRLDAIRNDTSGTAYIKELMVYEGTDDKVYEKYTGGIPSPNPDYPQDIEVIDNGWNRFDKNAVIKREYITDNGSVGKIDILSRTSKIKVQSGKKYTISGLVAISGYAWNVSFWNENTFINRITSLATVLTFSIPENCNYIILSVWNSDLSNVQLTEGTTLKSYLPHGSIGVEQSGKNKVDFINYVEKIFDSSKVEKLDDGSYKFKHVDASYPLYEGLLKPPCILSFWAKNDTGETIASYTFSFKIFYEDGTYDRVSMITNGNFERKEFKINKNVIKIANTYTITKPYTIIKDVQLEEGSTATSYEPHHETKLIPIDLQGNTLARVGDIKDKLRIYRNGKVEIERNIGKVVLDGNESWGLVYSKIYNNMCLYSTLIISSAINKNGTLCSNNFTYSSTFNEYVGEVINLNRGNGVIGIALNSSRCPNYTTAELKSWLSQHPTEVYYELATPQIITLPSIEPIELCQGTNIFKLITNLETDFEVEYVVDKDSVLDEVQTAMLDAEIEI